MLTLFTIPKPFTSAIAAAQNNTIESWKRLGPDCQIILFGDEEGIGEAARRHGVEHHAEVRRNEFGTPLLDYAFEVAQRRARHRRICYANADILFLSDLPRALSAISFEQYLLVGRRINLDISGAIEFTDSQWEARLRRRAESTGELFHASAIDYFIAPTGQLSILPFPVGRALWDNWMIHHARSCRIPVVDATRAVTAIHQNHDYGHISGGKKAAWYGVESERNWKMLGPDFLPLTIDDATFILDQRGLRPARDLYHLLRRMAVWPALSPRLRPSVRVARYLYRKMRRAQ